MNWETIAVSLVASIIVAIITMKLALSRFYREKWWEKRADSYIKLTEALYILKNNRQKILDHEMYSYYESEDSESSPDSKLTDAEQTEIYKKDKSIFEELERLSKLGPLLFTSSSVTKLKEFIKKERDLSLDAAYGAYGILDAYMESFNIANNLFIAVMDEAKMELRINSKWDYYSTQVGHKRIKIINWYINAERSYQDSVNGN